MSAWTAAEIEARILLPEWAFFREVKNEGGRAACQDDWLNFRGNRLAQFLTWSPEALASYAEDLRRARAEGRNPLSEKYGYMMEGTDPEAFARIAALLPPVEPRKAERVEALLRHYLFWYGAMLSARPDWGGERPVSSAEDSRGETSFETYLRGELQSYSAATLTALEAHAERCRARGENLLMRQAALLREGAPGEKKAEESRHE